MESHAIKNCTPLEPSPLVCKKCCSFLRIPPAALTLDQDADIDVDVDVDGDASCIVCLGLWNTSALTIFLQNALKLACEPYGGFSGSNKFSRCHQPPAVVIPGDILLRYHLMAEATSNEKISTSKLPSDFISELKEHVKKILINLLLPATATSFQSPSSSFPKFIEDEEQGFLCVHLVLIPALTEGMQMRPPCLKEIKKQTRKRRRHHHGDPSEHRQGGDARSNLEERLAQTHKEPLWSITDMQNTLDKAHPTLLQELQEWWQQHQQQQQQQPVAVMSKSPKKYKINLAVWRRAIYVRGLYTKSRRDVSQTPFFVPTTVIEENGFRRKSMKRLGVSSVEEEIAPAIASCCGGISSLNNNGDESNNVVYGMVKFHASGREDMDVRMLLPPTADANKIATGRPFCCEIVDAFSTPESDDLERVICIINHTEARAIAPAIMEQEKERVEAQSLVKMEKKEGTSTCLTRSYGKNPMGVGICSSSLSLAPASAFKNLQAETEEKVKFYGCVCWCEKSFSEQEMQQLLHDRYPLLLDQQTPIRVLHRRSNSVRYRNIRSLKVIWINAHWFRLHLSTDAGTYVKEFVHGDLGRTTPSVASLLGCKTDILQLDCEGIQGVK